MLPIAKQDLLARLQTARLAHGAASGRLSSCSATIGILMLKRRLKKIEREGGGLKRARFAPSSSRRGRSAKTVTAPLAPARCFVTKLPTYRRDATDTPAAPSGPPHSHGPGFSDVVRGLLECNAQTGPLRSRSGRARPPRLPDRRPLPTQPFNLNSGERRGNLTSSEKPFADRQ